MSERRQAKRALARLRWLLLTALWMGCDGLGRPLVDKFKKPPSPLGFLECATALSCDPQVFERAAEVQALEMQLVDLEACGGVRADCEAAASHQAGSGQGCFRVWKLDQTLSRHMDTESFRCSSLNAGTKDRQEIELEDVTLESTNLLFESSAPVTIRMAGASLSNTWVKLEGPITLELTDGWLSDTRFELGPDARLELEDSFAEGMMTSGPELSHEGFVSLRRSRLLKSHVRAQELLVESVSLNGSQIDVQVLLAADLRWQDGVLRVGEGTIAAAVLRSVEISECDVFNLIQSQFSDQRAGPCKEVMRLYTSAIDNASLEGPIQSDVSGFTKVRFGVEAKTNIHAWDVEFKTVLFCSGQRALTLGTDAEFACIQCADADLMDACLLPNVTTTFDGSCAHLQDVPDCEEPFPERERQ